MARKKVFIPAEIVSELQSIVENEEYEALFPVFEKVLTGETEYLNLDIQDAKNLLRLADIERSKAILRYPRNEEDDPRYNPVHEEKYEEVMRGVYEKTYSYVQPEFKGLTPS